MVDIQWVEMITAAEWCDHTPQQPPAGCGQRHQGGLDSGPGNDEALYKPLNCHSKIKQIIYIFRVRSWDIPPLVLKCRLDRSKYNTGSDYRCHIMTCLPHSIARTLVPWLQFPWIRVQQRCTFYTWYYFIPPAARVTAGGPPPRPHHRNERGVGAAPGLALCLMVPGHSLQTMCHTAGAGWGTFRISILSTILYGYQVKPRLWLSHCSPIPRRRDKGKDLMQQLWHHFLALFTKGNKN